MQAIDHPTKAVKVVKASAGSGKTYRLTQEYIDLLLAGDEQRYKHILAVTFTNKATDEMKQRVIEALYELSHSSDPRAEEAGKRLSLILHDYSCFSISTIDRFFQGVMRAFAREIGQYASYRVELDTGAVLEQVIDLLIDGLDDPANAALLAWLQDYAFELIEAGRSWNVREPLKAMAELFFKEDFRMKLRSMPGHILGDKDAIKGFGTVLETMRSEFEGKVTELGRRALAAMEAGGRAPEDFKGKSRGPFMVFRKWASWQRGDALPEPKESLYESYNGFQCPELEACVAEAFALSGQPLAEYRSVCLVQENLSLLGVYADIFRFLSAYLQENNVVLLSQSSDLLSRIINDEDTPFVYEKIGNRYDHLMLDESQDTSLLQWSNFKPLFTNSIAQGQANLIVGDVKQSIYRWRGSDWHLLGEQIARDLGPDNIDETNLGENWRSGREIIAFNNQLFSHAAETIAADAPAGVAEQIRTLYADCVQEVPPQRASAPAGRVKLSFLEPEGWREEALSRMLADIRELCDAGYHYRDITLLVRTNNDGATVANCLIAAGIGVVTEDSLLIGAAPCIGEVVSLLHALVDPEDPVNRLLVEGLELPEREALHGSLYETCEDLLASRTVLSASDVPFIHAFLDQVLAYQEKYGSSLRGFVRWWDDAGCKKSICAPEGQDAVRVMTIHKSKGLSLEAVIIPFVDEAFLKTSFWQIPTLWCQTTGALAPIGLVPVKATARMENTVFQPELDRERINQYVDVINMSYVAFTRAKSQLILYAPRPLDRDKYPVKTVAALLYRLFSEELDEADCRVSGTLEPFRQKKEASTVSDDPQRSFDTVRLGDERLKLALHAGDYFDADPSHRLLGIEKHRGMASVEVDAALEEQSGNRHWFDGSYRVFNEASIVTGEGDTYRPDRVLIAPDSSRVIVIDYKFGQARPSHRRQVRNYMDLLRQMGYPSVEGWLWYVTDGEFVRV